MRSCQSLMLKNVLDVYHGPQESLCYEFIVEDKHEGRRYI